MKHAIVNTEPTVEPVTIPDLRSWLRIDSHEEDDDLERFITMARIAAENETWSSIINTTWVQKYDGFADPLFLERPPVSSLTSIGYTDTAGDSQTLSSAIYELGEVDGSPVVRCKYGQVYPATRAHPDAVTITYVSGYGAAGTNVPQTIRDAIKTYAAHLWWNRGDAAAPPVPQAFYDLLSPRSYRVIA